MAWAGAREQKNNRNRSVSPNLLAPLAQIPGIRWFCLQKDQRPPYAPDPSVGCDFTDWTSELDDFADTAALMENLDLIVSADTSVVHLAGALGRPIWVMMAFAPDFRWMLYRDDSPWYPTMKLFRQPNAGNWQVPIERVTQALHAFRKA